MLAYPNPARSARVKHLGRMTAAGRKVVRDARDGMRFFQAWMRDPSGIAAVAPSGKALAALITRGIDETTGPVLELGSGTGAFAAALIARGVAPADLTLVEQNAGFARLLSARYPDATVLAIDAASVDGDTADGGRAFGAVVCGLGLLNMPDDTVEAILRAALERMAPGAAFYLFTYGPVCSVRADTLDRFGLVAERMGTALRNLPPATVYRLMRAAEVGMAPAAR